MFPCIDYPAACLIYFKRPAFDAVPRKVYVLDKAAHRGMYPVQFVQTECGRLKKAAFEL